MVVEGREVQEGGSIHIHVTDLLPCTEETQHCKAIIQQFKRVEEKNLIKNCLYQFSSVQLLSFV